MSIRPPILLSPAEEETRVVLRALFSRLLCMDASRYNPIYVGPLRRVEPVRRALKDAAAVCGIHVVELDSLAEGTSEGGVGIAPLAEVSRIAWEVGARRWIVVGDVDSDRLEPEFLHQLGEAGLIYDTRQLPAPPSGVSPLAAALGECSGTDGPWMLRVAAEPEAAAVVAAEVAVRLRVLGYVVGAVWEPGTESWIPPRAFSPEGRAGFVVHLHGTLPGATVCALADQSEACGAALVFVGTNASIAAVGAQLEPRFSAFVRTSPDPLPDAVRRAVWPPTRAVLTGAPLSGVERDLISQVDPQYRALNHIVRSAASWERRGYLLLFTGERFGWIAVDGRDSMVSGAWRLGDRLGSPSAEEVLARIRAMSLWEGVRALFVAASEPLPPIDATATILVDTVDLDLRRTSEEARDHRVPVGSLAAEVAPVPPSRVARELLWWGQARLAYELLQAAERASAWGVDEELLLGYLSAERDPRGAAARLQHAAHRLSDDLSDETWSQHVDATLSALLLDVRAYPAHALHAWGVVERWIESQGDAWVATPRRAAVVFELAARVGEIARAGRYRDRVLRLSNPGDDLPAWLETSDPLPHLEGAE